MAAHRRVYDSCHLQADCQEPESAPESYALQSSMGYHLPFTSLILTSGFVANPSATSGVHYRFHQEYSPVFINWPVHSFKDFLFAGLTFKLVYTSL